MPKHDTATGHAAFAAHDHTDCEASAMADAEAVCREEALRLTPLRRKVLEILLEGHRAVGAYDILAKLSEAGFSSQPPVAYRALDFLVENGFAHRLASVNAFLACGHPGTPHQPAFLICTRCRSVAEAETEATARAVAEAAGALGFEVTATRLEVEGLCPDCQKGQTA